jgi:hypothetical protein
LTNATPDTGAAPAANGNNWLVKLLPSKPTGGQELIQVATLARQGGVTVTGPAQVCFDALGMRTTTASATPGSGAPCAASGDDAGMAMSWLVSRTGASRKFKVNVYRAGRVELCDAAKELAKDSGACL